MSTKVFPTTNIATTVTKPSSIHVYYQDTDDAIVEKFYNKGWSPGSKLPFQAAPSTPLAAVNLTVNGQEWLRVYYLGTGNKLQEACYMSTRGWYAGGLDAQGIETAPNSSFAAFTFPDADQTSIRIYYQEKGTNKMQEVCYTNEKWFRGSTDLPVMLSGSGIAGMAYYFHDTLQHRVYYQAEDLKIHEYALVGNKWGPGEYKSPEVTSGQTALGALFTSGQGTVLDVYWMDMSHKITHSVQTHGEWDNSFVQDCLKPGAKFAVGQWEGGKHVRVYYQDQDGVIRELCKDDFNAKWVVGGFTAAAA